MKNNLIKSLLFVPGHKRNYLKNFNSINFDALVVDLEDAVPIDKKKEARKNLEDIKNFNLGKNLYVRLNYDKINLENDIKSCAKSKIRSFVLPKIDTPKDIIFIQKIIKKYIKSKNLKFLILIESAKAIINLKDICEFSKNINGLIFGAEDYLNDINVLDFHDNTNINFPRALIPIYAHAYNLNCIDTPYLNLINQKDFKIHLKTSKSLGYTGILNIHPKQCKLTNINYAPSKSDYKISKKIINSNKSYKYQNENISVLKNKLVGPPMIKRAKKIIEFFKND
jgi:citrate lyase subunit beta / citryl-CoA lyase